MLAVFLYFSLSYLLEMLLQLLDGRQHVQALVPVDVLVHLLADDVHHLGNLLLAFSQVLADDALQIVDVVQENVVQVAHLGFDVARHGDVDEKERPVVAMRHDLADHFRGNDRLPGRRRADHHIRLLDAAVQFAEGDGGGAELPGQLLRFGQRAVCDAQAMNAALLQIHQRHLGDLAGADHEHVFVEIGKDLLRQFHSHAADGGRAPAYAGLVAAPFADAKRLVECFVQKTAGGFRLHRQRVGVAHLPKNLILAQHHGVQSGGHFEKMLHRLKIARFVKIIPGDIRVLKVEILRENVTHTAVGHGRGVVGDDVKFGSVAGGEDDGLFDARLLVDMCQEISAFIVVEGKTLANVERGFFVIDACEID